MKTKRIGVIALLLLLLLSGCGKQVEETQPTEFQVVCFGCKQAFSTGQLNPDFGLCQDCMMDVGAAYCQNCSAPCYTRDMIQGLCKTCHASAGETVTEPEVPEFVICKYCGYSVRSDYMVGDYCAGCYAMREGKCLRCTYLSHMSDGAHCEHCSTNRFYCANCNKRIPGSEMFLDLCTDCYWKVNSVLIPCPLCGRSIAPSEVKGGFCHSCYAQSHYDETEPPTAPPAFYCSACGRDFKTADDLYEGKCWSCYNEGKDLCVDCHKRPSDGLGPSGMECAECYYKDNAACLGCGYDFWKDDMISGYCNSCYNDVMIGSYSADFENVRITITRPEYGQYYLTYEDLSSGITLKNIPQASYGSDPSSGIILAFDLDAICPAHSGYVELTWMSGFWSYNALIEGLEDSGGDYSPLTKDLH